VVSPRIQNFVLFIEEVHFVADDAQSLLVGCRDLRSKAVGSAKTRAARLLRLYGVDPGSRDCELRLV
jgi:hypothetical protein